MAGTKRRMGDRRDGALVRNLDSMHLITPIIYPNRCDNEAYISERIDLSALDAYLARRNAASPEYKYNLFQCIVTAFLKTVTLRPKMNRYVANKSLYQRNKLTAAFVVKKQFSDEAKEALAIIEAKPEDTLDTIHDRLYHIISDCRNEKAGSDSSTDAMDMFARLPRWVFKAAINFCCMLERHDKIPKSFIASDPYYSTVVFSNLGSIKLKSGYHHLTNWGTTSVFCIIGEMKQTPAFDEEGRATMRHTVDLGITVDERIADGYYFSQTIKLFKSFLENPELLEKRLDAE